MPRTTTKKYAHSQTRTIRCRDQQKQGKKNKTAQKAFQRTQIKWNSQETTYDDQKEIDGTGDYPRRSNFEENSNTVNLRKFTRNSIKFTPIKHKLQLGQTQGEIEEKPLRRF